ncbi:MAG: hypothetical protein IT204_20295 [Fimbriimonadaceae bacterium]|nr:hypothetical protein [Fimbriimonadaceae bacterium]
MGNRRYFSERAGRHPTGGKFDLDGLRSLFLSTYRQLASDGYFQEALGYDCVDAGRVPGSCGSDLNAFFYTQLARPSLWPIEEKSADYSEDDVFDVIELLHDISSKGIEGTYHQYGDCGMHYTAFDQDAGRQMYRQAVQRFLRRYRTGFDLSVDGQIVAMAPDGLGDLLDQPPPSREPAGVGGLVARAVRKFRHRGATESDRREAVRDLADVLEYLRSEAKRSLTSKDEGDLFNIANNFGIRHCNDHQKTDYDPEIWLDWIFYWYLATIHAISQVIEKRNQ